MAVKKQAATTTKAKSGGASASETKASPKKTAPKKATATASAPKAAPAVASGTTPKAGTPKATKAAPKKAAPKKAAPAPVKLTDRQLDVLKAIHGTKEQGYLADKKAEAKTIDALASKKLIKKGAKDKASGHVRYHVSKAGEKHVSSTASAS